MPLVAVRWTTVLAAAFVAVFVTQVGTFTNTVGVAGPATQVIVMGDSLAAGCCGIPYDERWATIFAEETSNDLVNLGIGGTRSYGLVDQIFDWPSGRSQSQLDEALSLLAEATPGAVSVVTLGIGANDWLWLRDPDGTFCAFTSTPACDDLVAQAVAGIEVNLHIALTELTAALEPDTHLLVMTYYDIWNQDSTSAMNNIILSEIAEHGAIHVDVPKFLSGHESEFISDDTVHPSTEGQRLLANIFVNAIPPDSDHDGLADVVEAQLGSDPDMADTDGDGLEDGLEILVYGSDVFDPDTDGDGCSDGAETSDNASQGGLRDPLNPWDFYDVAGFGGGPPDGVVDLANDLLGVIQHYSPTGAAPYDVRFDRGPSSGPNPWNMSAPDGVIDLPNDFLGIVLQFNHRCW
ncbi:MAG: SGNH/GDSL hydrolase family protein [Chloroflexi bacterium]|nr:SGNH/GDSL hydrolase family protein [Chloroflexota bacterium]